MSPLNSSRLARRTFLRHVGAVILLGTGARRASAEHDPSGPHPLPVYHRTSLSAFDSGEDPGAWHRAPRVPLWESPFPHEQLIIQAIRRNEPLYGRYNRWGSVEIRRLSPILLFRNDWSLEEDSDLAPVQSSSIEDEPALSPSYLLAWDHNRRASRTFRAEHFSPEFTAPWMKPYAGDIGDSTWQQKLAQTAQKLRNSGIQPIMSEAPTPRTLA